MAELAEEAIAVQDACNLSGVVLGFGRSISRLRQLLQGPQFGTELLNTHPICKLWSDKIADLSRSRNSDEVWGAAYAEVKALAATTPRGPATIAEMESPPIPHARYN